MKYDSHETLNKTIIDYLNNNYPDLVFMTAEQATEFGFNAAGCSIKWMHIANMKYSSNSISLELENSFKKLKFTLELSEVICFTPSSTKKRFGKVENWDKFTIWAERKFGTDKFRKFLMTKWGISDFLYKTIIALILAFLTAASAQLGSSIVSILFK